MSVKFRCPLFCVVALYGLSVVSVAYAQDSAGIVSALETAPVEGHRWNRNEQKIEDALKKPVRFDYFETRFGDVVAEWRADYGIPVIIDESAADLSLDEERLITLELEDISLKAGLEVMLAPYECTSIVKNEVLYILGREKADQILFVRVYDCRSLMELLGGASDENHEKLISVLTSTVNAKSWEVNGGNAGVAEIGGKLVISQSRDGHDKVAEVLKYLRSEFRGGAQTQKNW